jgi:hypothetical protein
MSNSKNHKPSSSPAKPLKKIDGKKRMLMLTASLTVILMTSGVLAQWIGIFSFSRISQSVSPASLNRNMPAKEYLYAGGKLIATEEPIAANLAAPATLRSVSASGTQIQITWNAVPNATHYELQRTASYNQIGGDHGFQTIHSNATSPYIDTVPIPGNAYIYRVRALDVNNQASPYSNLDMATAVIFTDDPITTGVTTVKEIHITQLRAAVEAVTFLAGQAGPGWTDPPPLAQQVNIKKIHIEQLRSNLGNALMGLPFPAPPAYTDPTITATSTVVKAVHIRELRSLLKGYQTYINQP